MMNHFKLEGDSGTLHAPVAAGPIARSPSRESLATDLSLMSLSSLGSDFGRLRTSSLGQCRKGEDGWSVRSSRHCLRLSFDGSTRHHLANEILFEEDTEIIRNCGALCSAFGLMKSFSTSDLANMCVDAEPLRSTASELALSSWRKYEMNQTHHEHPSRSCSTWVAVGEGPSPQPGAKDFVRSVNQKIRQVYIRRRLVSTYKALERLTRSQLNLPDCSQHHVTSLGFHGANKTLCLTVKDIERDKGKPLSKYERNIMIFTWLQSLDENAFDQLT